METFKFDPKTVPSNIMQILLRAAGLLFLMKLHPVELACVVYYFAYYNW